MLNETRIAVRGNVATEPLLKVTSSGTTVCSFRLAVTPRRWSADERRSIDGDTSWFTVTCWRALAENAAASLAKGQGVVVLGRLRVRDYKHEDAVRTTADVIADGLGHDLTWGTTEMTPTRRSRAEEERADADRVEADALAREVSASTPTDAAAGPGGSPVAEPATAAPF